MKDLKCIGQSGGGSLYILLRNIHVEKDGHDGTTIFTVIKKIIIKIHYDHHATSGFTFDEIIHDFRGKVAEICDNNCIDWRRK